MINNEEYKKDAIELYKCCDAIVDRIVNLRLNNKETVAEMAGTHSLMEKTIVNTMQFISCSLDYIKEINEKVNGYETIIEKLTKENIELKNNFEIACKSTDVLYDTFLKVEAERDAAVNDIESLIHDDHMEVCDLCNLNQDNAFRCKATCAKAHWRGVNNKC